MSETSSSVSARTGSRSPLRSKTTAMGSNTDRSCPAFPSWMRSSTWPAMPANAGIMLAVLPLPGTPPTTIPALLCHGMTAGSPTEVSPSVDELEVQSYATGSVREKLCEAKASTSCQLNSACPTVSWRTVSCGASRRLRRPGIAFSHMGSVWPSIMRSATLIPSRSALIPTMVGTSMSTPSGVGVRRPRPACSHRSTAVSMSYSAMITAALRRSHSGNIAYSCSPGAAGWPSRPMRAMVAARGGWRMTSRSASCCSYSCCAWAICCSIALRSTRPAWMTKFRPSRRSSQTCSYPPMEPRIRSLSLSTSFMSARPPRTGASHTVAVSRCVIARMQYRASP
ncbi:hypothetical protein TSOC111612_24090 [Tsukamurella ocularis]